MKDGEWVQEYTRRGAPMRGKYRWRTRKQRAQELVAGVLIAVVIVLAIIAPAIFGWTPHG